MGPAAGAASLVSAGLSAYSSISSAKGTQAADDAQADRLERAAAYGKTAAVQTGAQYTEELNTILGNIDTIRTAGNVDPSSPTSVAIRDRQTYLGERQKNIAVENILAQAEQNESDAAYMRKAGTFALKMGYVGAAAGALKTVGATNWSNFGVGNKTVASGANA